MNSCSPACPRTVEYYVEAGGVQDPTLQARVVDLPGVKKIRVTYHYPSWLGMKDAVEDPGGDLRAVEGTAAEVADPDRSSAEQRRPRCSTTARRSARIARRRDADRQRTRSQKDGLYHIAAIDHGEERAPERGLFHRSAQRLRARR